MGYGIKDTPWHIVTISSSDGRRDKTRCTYFQHIQRKRGFCNKQNFECPGSTHCDFYKENKPLSIKYQNTPIEENEIKKCLLNKRIISPYQQSGTIIGVDLKNMFIYIKMDNTNAEIKISIVSLKDQKSNNWKAAEKETQQFILNILNNIK